MLYKYTLDRTEIKETRPAIPNADISLTFKRRFEPGCPSTSLRIRDERINQDLGRTRMEGIGGWTKIIIPLESWHPFQGFPIYTNNHPSAGSPLATGSFPVAEKWKECR